MENYFKDMLYRGLYLSIIAVLASAAIAGAQQKTGPYRGRINVVPKEFVKQGNSVKVKMDIILDSAKIKSNRALDITPVITDGTQNVNLPKVSIKGRRKYKEYRRAEALMTKSERAAYIPPYSVEKGYPKNTSGKISYDTTVPYQDWMNKANLDAKLDLCGCNNEKELVTNRLADNLTMPVAVKPYKPNPSLAYVPAEPEKVKQRSASDMFLLKFPVDKTYISSGFADNSKILSDVNKMVDNVKNGEGVTIKNIQITGYASPEGTVAHNKSLSEARARALQKYLQQRYPFISAGSYSTEFGGEDWEGLKLAVENSDMQYKDEVLDIIDKYDVMKGREKKLMDLKGGVPYRYMLKNMFPSLRRVACKVGYDVANFDVDQARRNLETNPQNLSLDEIMKVAATYEKGSDEYNKVMNVAVKMFPQSEVANIDAANGALLHNDIETAERYLSRIEPKIYKAEYNNTKGALLMMQGKYAEAEKLLKLAQNNGVTEATANLKELEKARKSSGK